MPIKKIFFFMLVIFSPLQCADLSSPSTALLWHARTGNILGVQQALQDGADINVQDAEGCTPLIHASIKDYEPIVDTLLCYPHIDVNHQTNFFSRSPGCSACSLAAYKGNIKTLLRLMLDPHIDLNVRNAYGNSPIMSATREGHVKIVELLAQNPAVDLNIANNEGYQPFMTACADGKEPIVDILLRHKDRLEINGASYTRKNTALILATRNNRATIVQKLIMLSHLLVNMQDDQGYTALARASECGFLSIIDMLLSRPDIDVNRATFCQCTPLYLAITHDHTDTAIHLLMSPKKVALDAMSITGETALSVAKRHKNRELVQLLEEEYKKNSSMASDIASSSASTPQIIDEWEELSREISLSTYMQV